MEKQPFKKDLKYEVPDEFCYLRDVNGLEIQIASDLHIEFYNAKFPIPDDLIVPAAPVLALLGDIGKYHRIGVWDFRKFFTRFNNKVPVSFVFTWKS
jgi:hypothetical protein